MGLGLGFSPLQAGLYDQGCWVFSGGSSHLFISPIAKSVITEVEGFSLQAGCSARRNALTLAFLCCFPAAYLEIRNSSWNRIAASGDQPRDRELFLKEDCEGPVQVALGGAQEAVRH